MSLLDVKHFVTIMMVQKILLSEIMHSHTISVEPQIRLWGWDHSGPMIMVLEILESEEELSTIIRMVGIILRMDIGLSITMIKETIILLLVPLLDMESSPIPSQHQILLLEPKLFMVDHQLQQTIQHMTMSLSDIKLCMELQVQHQNDMRMSQSEMDHSQKILQDLEMQVWDTNLSIPILQDLVILQMDTKHSTSILLVQEMSL